MPDLIAKLGDEAIELLRQLIATPSFSREETGTADLLAMYLREHGIYPHRVGNNVWAQSLRWDTAKPTLLLNSHHDTVKPGAGWTYPPFEATLEGDRLTGLGSNDAGASVVSLLATFRYFYNRPAAFNLVCAITAEEEISGEGGIRWVLPELVQQNITLGIVGEPTGMQAAVAEKGLLVLDCVVRGRTGHAARDEGDNALYRALDDISWLRGYQFPRVSALLGPVKMTVTQIQAGTQHNVVPDECRYVVDVRPTECYTNEEVLATIRAHVQAEVTPRSTHLQSSGLPLAHPLARRAVALGKTPYGSPTLSDQALLPFPTLKMGPGDSARSHTPDEYILLSEIRAGIADYVALLTDFEF